VEAGAWLKNFVPICDACKTYLQHTEPDVKREYILAEPPEPIEFVTLFHQLPACIRDKLSFYLLGESSHKREWRLGTTGPPAPIKTLAIVEWLSPGYHRNNDKARMKRIVTEAFVSAPSEEEGNEQVSKYVRAEREEKDKRRMNREGWCSCCGYGGCKQAMGPPYHNSAICQTCNKLFSLNPKSLLVENMGVYEPMCPSCSVTMYLLGSKN
jgi:hypothetical protein